MNFTYFEGRIHDRVDLGEGDVCVIAGDDETDSVSCRLAFGGFDSSVRLTAAEAIELGRLLVAAGEDTLSRPVTPKDAGTDEVAP